MAKVRNSSGWVSIEGFVAFVSVLATFATMFGGSIFRQWETSVTFHRMSMDISLTFPVLFALGCSVGHIVLRRVACLSAHLPVGPGLRSLQAGLLVLVVNCSAATIAYYLLRPANFPLSLMGLVFFYGLAGLVSLHLVILAVAIRNGDRDLQSEIAATPRLANGALLSVSLLASMLMIEVALRVHNPFLFRARGDKISLQPYHRDIIENNASAKLEPIIIRTTNGIGFRGEDPPVDLKDRLSIVFVGGSTTEDYYLSDSKMWTAVAGSGLDRCSRAVWWNNAGLVGHSTYAHAILLDGNISRLKPKVIVFLIGINDLAKDIITNDTAYIVKAENSVNSELTPQIASLLEILSGKSELFAVVENLQRSHRANQAGLVSFHVNFSYVDRIPVKDRTDVDPEVTRELLEMAKPALRNYETRIRGLIERSRAMGALPVLATQPLLWGEGRDPTSGSDLAISTEMLGGRQVSALTLWRALDAYNDVVRKVGRDEGLPVIDLARTLPKDFRYFIDKMHFSVEGAGFVGDVVGRELCSVISRRFPELAKVP